MAHHIWSSGPNARVDILKSIFSFIVCPKILLRYTCSSIFLAIASMD
jgi:hypothetical protein